MRWAQVSRERAIDAGCRRCPVCLGAGGWPEFAGDVTDGHDLVCGGCHGAGYLLPTSGAPFHHDVLSPLAVSCIAQLYGEPC